MERSWHLKEASCQLLPVVRDVTTQAGINETNLKHSIIAAMQSGPKHRKGGVWEWKGGGVWEWNTAPRMKHKVHRTQLSASQNSDIAQLPLLSFSAITTLAVRKHYSHAFLCSPLLGTHDNR